MNQCTPRGYFADEKMHGNMRKYHTSMSDGNNCLTIRSSSSSAIVLLSYDGRVLMLGDLLSTASIIAPPPPHTHTPITPLSKCCVY